MDKEIDTYEGHFIFNEKGRTWLRKESKQNGDGSRIVNGYNVDKICMSRPWVVYIRLPKNVF